MMVELLGTGEQNAQTAKRLAEQTNLSVRDITKMIRIERLAGNPICSNSKGYFLPDNDAEMRNTIRRLYKQGRETIKVADAMRLYQEKGRYNGT